MDEFLKKKWGRKNTHIESIKWNTLSVDPVKVLVFEYWKQNSLVEIIHLQQDKFIFSKKAQIGSFWKLLI